MTTSSYFAIDPGETCGWASFDDKGDVIDMGQFRFEKFTQSIDSLLHSGLKQVICEDYRNHGFTQQKKWSRNNTSKVIGKIELLAELRGVPVVLQPNTVKAIGYRWGGLPDGPPSNHAISHQYDAYAHGVFWLQQQGIRPVGRSLLAPTDEGPTPA
jgi:hypothetical protein